MEPMNINTTANAAVHHTTLSQTDPLHQYATTPQNTPPQHAPTPYYPQHVSTYPTNATAIATSQTLAAGMFGLIIVGTGAMGANLHKVNDGDMSMGEALSNSLVKGAAGGIAAASATAASTTLTSGGIAGLAVTLATATGVGYLLSK